jgi:hypothetical protein
MSLANFIARMKRFEKDAELIFDREEPIGRATDLVLPRRRWFSNKHSASALNSPREEMKHLTRRGQANGILS